MSNDIAYVIIRSVPFEGYKRPLAVCDTEEAAHAMLAVLRRSDDQTGSSGLEIIEVPRVAGGQQ